MNYKYYTICLEYSAWFFNPCGEWKLSSYQGDNIYECSIPPQNAFVKACNAAKELFDGKHCVKLLGYRDGEPHGSKAKQDILMSKEIKCR